MGFRCSCDLFSENEREKLIPLSLFDEFGMFILQLRANYLAIL